MSKYSWAISEMDEKLANWNYGTIKQLPYAEKIYIFKYLNCSWWEVRYWDKCDQELFYNVNIYINRNLHNKLNFACNFENKIDKIVNIYKELDYEDSLDINLFSYINRSDFMILNKETQDLFKKYIIYQYGKDYSAFLGKFVMLFTDELTKANAKTYGNYHSNINDLMFLMKIINFVKYIYPDCIYNDEFNDNVNKLLYCHFNCAVHHNYSEVYDLTNEDKDYISKVFTSKTKIRDIHNVSFIMNWLTGYLTVKEERDLVNKFTFKKTKEHYRTETIIKKLDKITITNDENKALINNLKFELALK